MIIPPEIERSWNDAFWLLHVAMLYRSNNVHKSFKMNSSRIMHIQGQQNFNLVTLALQRENSVPWATFKPERKSKVQYETSHDVSDAMFTKR